jgi:GntR family transcriptional regulator
MTGAFHERPQRARSTQLPAGAATIDRSSVLPFYYQLKQILLADISERGLLPGDRLPGDHELCASYDISRTVVRQALAELETEGVIERIKGRGTFVAPHRTGEHLVQSLTGLFEDVQARGSHLRSLVRRLEVVPADAMVATELQLEPGAAVILIERLRYVDEEPWVLATTQLPYELAPGLVHEDLTNQSLYALLENKYQVKLRHGQRSVEAAAANDELARSLGILRGDPVLVLRSIVYGDDRPVETFVAYHRGDRSRFEVNLTRNSSSPQRSEPLMRVLADKPG